MPSLRFTKTTLAKLPVTVEKTTLWYDEDTPGFGLRVSPGGSRQWVLQYRPVGERNEKRLTIGPTGTLSLDEARAQAKLMRAKALTGDDPHAAKATKKAEAKVTLGKTAEDYLAFKKPIMRPGTHYLNTLYLRKHWGPLHTRPLTGITRAMVVERLDELVKESGPASANRCRSALSALYTWSMKRGLCEANPVAMTLVPAEEKARDRVLTVEEMALAWRHAGEGAFGAIIRLLCLTGQRRDEVGGITDDELDLKAGLWNLPAARSKNKRDLTIPLATQAVDILESMPRIEGDDTLFSRSPNGFSGWSKSRERVEAAMLADYRETHGEKATIAHWTLHDIRRSVATHLGDVIGAHPHIVESILGHVSGFRSGVAGTYNRAQYLNERRDALQSWADHLSAAVATAERKEDGGRRPA